VLFNGTEIFPAMLLAIRGGATVSTMPWFRRIKIIPAHHAMGLLAITTSAIASMLALRLLELPLGCVPTKESISLERRCQAFHLK
jgi:hypothetical protein